MKVLHVSAGAVYGGVERVLSTLSACRGLCPQMMPHFAVCFEGRLAWELRDAGSPVHMLGEVRVSRPWTVLQARAALRRVVREERFEAVVCHLPWAYAVFGSVVPSVFWMHGFATGRHWTERWARRTVPRAVIANSRATAATAALLFPDVEARVCYNPVPVRSPGIRAGENACSTSTVILCASRMEPWKGHALLLEALALLDGPWRCWIAGGAQRSSEEQYAGGLREKAVSLGIADRVEFLGQRDDLPQLFSRAGIFCQPNTGPEPFGLVFVEALAAGIPVVTTRLGAAPEIVDESCGILTPPGDGPALARALSRLLGDVGERLRLGAAGPARARLLCDPERQLHALYDILERSRNTPDI